MPTVVVMNRSRQMSPVLLSRAELQAGIFTKRQLSDAGSSDSALARAISDGICHRVEPGLFSLHPLLTGRARLWAGLLLGGPEARLDGEAARFARGGGPAPEFVDIWTGQSSRRGRGCWRFHTGQPPADPESDEDESDKAMGELLTTRTLKRALISQYAERQLGIRTRQLMLDLSEHHVDDGASVLETRWRKNVEGPHALPPLTWTGSDANGARIIGGFGDTRVRVELRPCRPHHRRKHVWERWETDCSDGPIATRLGDQITVSLNWDDVVGQPCGVAEALSRILLEAGLPHDPIPCARCPRVTHPSAWGGDCPIDTCPTCGSRLAPFWTPPSFSDVGPFAGQHNFWEEVPTVGG